VRTHAYFGDSDGTLFGELVRRKSETLRDFFGVAVVISLRLPERQQRTGTAWFLSCREEKFLVVARGCANGPGFSASCELERFWQARVVAQQRFRRGAARTFGRG